MSAILDMTTRDMIVFAWKIATMQHVGVAIENADNEVQTD